MGKINKEFQWRMQGILHAREVVAKDGLEVLDKEIKMRGFMQAPLVYSNSWKRRWHSVLINFSVFNSHFYVLLYDLSSRFYGYIIH